MKSRPGSNRALQVSDLLRGRVTRVVLAVTGVQGQVRQLASGAVQLTLTGSGEMEARHQYLGKQTAEIRVRGVEP
jgi:hypothetical protein